MSVRTAPCDWPVADLECLVLEGLDAPVREALEESAVSWLWDWSGRQYGICEVELWPVVPPTYTSTYQGRWGWVPWRPVKLWDGFHNIYCKDLGYQSGTTVRLPGPVQSVTTVEVDGVVLPADAWRLDNNNILVRTDGARWPVSSDLNNPVFRVVFDRGIEVPHGGQIAAAVLLCELAKSITGKPDCQLPKRVSTVTREGVTIGILDDMEGLDKGRTGIWVVDSWLASVTKRPKRARVMSPDTMPHRSSP